MYLLLLAKGKVWQNLNLFEVLTRLRLVQNIPKGSPRALAEGQRANPLFWFHQKIHPVMPIFSNGHEKNFFEPQKNFLNASHFCQQKFFAFSKKISAKAPLPARQKKSVQKSAYTKIFEPQKF